MNDESRHVALLDIANGVAFYDRQSYELISKPSQANYHTGEINKGVVEVAVRFVANDNPAEVSHPGNRAFHDPSFLEVAKSTSVLHWEYHAALTLVAD